MVQIFSTQWFLPVIQHNPHWKRELCHLFPGGGKNAFQVLAKKLLKPSRVVQAKIDSVMERVPEGVKLIGLQVRRTENNAVGQGIEDSFLSCAADVVREEEEKFRLSADSGSGRTTNIIDRRQSDDRSPGDQGEPYYPPSSIVQRGHYLGRNISISGSTDNKGNGAQTGLKKPSFSRFAYYLATDYRPTRAHFQEVLGDQLIVLDNTFQSAPPVSSPVLSGISDDEGDTLGISSPDSSPIKNNDDTDLPPSSASSTSSSQTEAVVRNSVQGVQTAVAEMFLLAQADRIISSPYSTFGYFAHGYANVQPNIVKRDGTCIKRKSTQPCFQYWFGFANGGAKCQIRSTIEMSEDYDCWL